MDAYKIFEYTLLTFQWIALVLAMISYKKYKNEIEKVFLIVILLGVASETSTFVFRYFEIVTSIQFNIYTFVSISIYHVWFYKIIPAYKKSVILGYLLFITVFIYCLVSESFFNTLYTNPVVLAGIIMFVFSILYFKNLLEQDEVIHIYSSQRFWIVTGVLIFSLGIAPVLYFQDSIDVYSTGYVSIIMLLNIILYGSFIISFLCLYRK